MIYSFVTLFPLELVHVAQYPAKGFDVRLRNPSPFITYVLIYLRPPQSAIIQHRFVLFLHSTNLFHLIFIYSMIRILFDIRYVILINYEILFRSEILLKLRILLIFVVLIFTHIIVILIGAVR